LTAALPLAVQDTFRSFLTCELTTIDASGRPITWPVTPFYRPGDTHISVTTGLGWPKKARDARRNPKVALLFSDSTGSDVGRPSMVLVQGQAGVDDHDLDANRDRYLRDHAEKLGRSAAASPSTRFDWYFARIYIHVRPERVYLWRGGDCEAEPELFELAEPSASRPAPPEPVPARAHTTSRLHELGRRYETAVLSVVAPDGYPFSIRVPVSTARRGRTVQIDAHPAPTLPLLPGPACVTAHDHGETLEWTRSFQVRGHLLGDRGGWNVAPQQVVDGFELPPVGPLTRAVLNFRKIRRFRRTAKALRSPGARFASGGSAPRVPPD
jgi:hypothetical protein